jgi:hypothetical protein
MVLLGVRRLAGVEIPDLGARSHDATSTGPVASRGAKRRRTMAFSTPTATVRSGHETAAAGAREGDDPGTRATAVAHEAERASVPGTGTPRRDRERA